MQSSELESGLPDEAEQECIVFFLLGIVVNQIANKYLTIAPKEVKILTKKI